MTASDDPVGGAARCPPIPIIRPNDSELKAYLRERGIRTVLFPAEAYPFSDVMLARWFAYRDYLRRRLAKGKRYRNILITDVRDVIFQKPLFSMACAALEFQFEAPEPRIGACPINSNWVRKGLGEAALGALAQKRITCAGTVSGRQAGILQYIDAVTGLIGVLNEEGLAASGVDQGVHNYIAYNVMIEDAVFLDNFRRVATLHYVDGASLRADAYGRVVNPDGSVSELAHQWDRHPHLVAAIEAQAERRRLTTSIPFRRRLRLLGRWINRFKLANVVGPRTALPQWISREVDALVQSNQTTLALARDETALAHAKVQTALALARDEMALAHAKVETALALARDEIALLRAQLEEAKSNHWERSGQLEQKMTEQLESIEGTLSTLRSRDFMLERLLTASPAARPPGAPEAVARIGVPAVSIILPTYNRAGFVGEAIESVRAQVFNEWELIVVDDGSSDDTQAVVASFLSDRRIRYVRQTRSGSSAARNKGLDATKAALVAYIDSDNVWYPDFLYCAVDYLATHPDVDLLYGALVTDLHCLDNSNVLWKPFNRAALIEGNFIDTNVIVHRRELLTKYGNWDPRLSRVNDWDLVLRFTADKEAYPLPVLATFYRSCDKIRVTEVDPNSLEYEMSVVREKLKIECCETG